MESCRRDGVEAGTLGAVCVLFLFVTTPSSVSYASHLYKTLNEKLVDVNYMYKERS
jgi:hypothetical protein